MTRAEFIRKLQADVKLQTEAEARNVSVCCQDHGALPGERCTPTMRACSARKRAGREADK